MNNCYHVQLIWKTFCVWWNISACFKVIEIMQCWHSHSLLICQLCHSNNIYREKVYLWSKQKNDRLLFFAKPTLHFAPLSGWLWICTPSTITRRRSGTPKRRRKTPRRSRRRHRRPSLPTKKFWDQKFRTFSFRCWRSGACHIKHSCNVRFIL